MILRVFKDSESFAARSNCDKGRVKKLSKMSEALTGPLVVSRSLEQVFSDVRTHHFSILFNHRYCLHFIPILHDKAIDEHPYVSTSFDL